MTEISALLRFLHVTASILLVGEFAFALLVHRPITWSQGQSRAASIAAAIVVLTALAGLALQYLSVGDGSEVSLATLLFATHYGQVWLLRIALATVVALLLARASFHLSPTSAVWIGAGFILSAALLASQSFAGHAAAGEGTALLLQVLVHSLHFVFAGLWIGGLVPLRRFLSECRQQADAAAAAVASLTTRRFSALALIAVIGLLCSGAYDGWNLVGGVPQLFGTNYGKLLLGKLTLVVLLIAIGAINLRRLKPQLLHAASLESSFCALSKLSRNVNRELVLAVMVLAIAGHMGVTPPARHVQPDWPFAFRWDWAALEKAPKARAEVDRGLVWVGVGGLAMLTAVVRRRRRMLSGAIAIGALGYAAAVVTDPVATDAYPLTYRRPAVTYNAISVANGRRLYYESGCAGCHGENGYGDGANAEGLNPKPADLTAPHANNHTAGDLFWWLSHGVKPTSAMPGYEKSLSEEERWDLINYLRALSSGERARDLATVIDSKPWLVAPDFNYGLVNGDAKTLKDHRTDKIVLVALLPAEKITERTGHLTSLAKTTNELQILLVPQVPSPSGREGTAAKWLVSEGNQEIIAAYGLFARSFAEEKPGGKPPHVEYLIDKQGYIRARWLPAENDGWKNLIVLQQQIDALRQEPPRAPAPDDHVH